MADHLDTLDLDGLRREAERLGYVRDLDPDDGLPWWRAGRDGRVVCLLWPLDQWGADGRFLGDEADALRWLLRTDDACARRECYERGAAEARAAIVARVRAALADVGRSVVDAEGAAHHAHALGLREAHRAITLAVNAIERGEAP